MFGNPRGGDKVYPVIILNHVPAVKATQLTGFGSIGTQLGAQLDTLNMDQQNRPSDSIEIDDLDDEDKYEDMSYYEMNLKDYFACDTNCRKGTKVVNCQRTIWTSHQTILTNKNESPNI